MSILGMLIVFSPLAAIALSWSVESSAARHLLRALGLVALVALLPSIWLSVDCRGTEITYMHCELTPPGLAGALTGVSLTALLGWLLAVPLLAVVAGGLEWRARRRG